ncbi:thioredoxin-dependent thiol peroxidase [Bacillus sp. 165]|uniref:thioredoxin-dependent thiol peroxidase n=1 Tax=Bacillus sp. 165 TaxID=1529117 RepID=UPI001ADD51DE|nr:thioredoxin-dependent thiol peroxidase [Bacillus sp. 165]MBO9130949.1 thioredoxin-dependent thiol peroxidase [Bacillus sp. 165]
MIETGTQAPEFTLSASNGKDVSLSDFLGKNVVIYFYPKDMTPGCTTQACDFRDAFGLFQEEETVILGISPDPIAKHAKFIEKHQLPFLLLVDEQHQAAQLYNVWKLKKNFGKEYMGIERSTFVINKHGELVKEWRKVKVKNHVQEVLNYIQDNLK